MSNNMWLGAGIFLWLYGFFVSHIGIKADPILQVPKWFSLIVLFNNKEFVQFSSALIQIWGLLIIFFSCINKIYS